MQAVFNKIEFEYGKQGEAIQVVVDGIEQGIFSLDGQAITLEGEYGYKFTEQDIEAPAWFEFGE